MFVNHERETIDTSFYATQRLITHVSITRKLGFTHLLRLRPPYRRFCWASGISVLTTFAWDVKQSPFVSGFSIYMWSCWLHSILLTFERNHNINTWWYTCSHINQARSITCAMRGLSLRCPHLRPIASPSTRSLKHNYWFLSAALTWHHPATLPWCLQCSWKSHF